MGAALVLLALGGRTRADEPGTDAVTSVDIGLQQLGSGLGSITSITNAGDSRVFLTTQDGRILISNGTTILPGPFLDLTSVVQDDHDERGLLSVAFHPSYGSNGLFFVYYVDANGNIAIARYKNPTPSGNAADPASGVILLNIPHPTNANHNGGQLQFGLPDGYLYLGTGDGGASNDPPCNAQNDAVALGKLLRLDVDQNVNTPPFYGIPASNPQAGGPFPENITWAKGLRNPWRFSFDRAAPHDLWIGDVGQDEWEEIDHEPATAAGLNYGWKVMEGLHCGAGGTNNCSPTTPVCNSPVYTLPVFNYQHLSGRCAIMGGYVYRGSLISGLQGSYIYGDLCTGEIWSLGSSTAFTPKVPGLQTFGQDSAGELYLGDGSGNFYQIVPSAGTPTSTPTKLSTKTPTPNPFARETPVPVEGHRPPTRELTPRPTD